MIWMVASPCPAHHNKTCSPTRLAATTPHPRAQHRCQPQPLSRSIRGPKFRRSEHLPSWSPFGAESRRPIARSLYKSPAEVKRFLRCRLARRRCPLRAHYHHPTLPNRAGRRPDTSRYGTTETHHRRNV